MLRYLILGVLSEGKPLHGFLIAQTFKSRSGQAIRSSSIYREIGRLAAEGLIARVDNAAGADPRRIAYEITDAGRGELEAWQMAVLDALLSPDASLVNVTEDPLALRALFVAQIDQRATLLNRWKEALLLLGSRVETAHKGALMRAPQLPSLLPLLFARRTRQIAGDVDFIDELIAFFENGRAAPHSGEATRTELKSVRRSSRRQR